ncbi:MAG: M18 family aminopeptidase [Spirochaetaceae bacterium]|nr:MAG: M18 family aminopeptidase [Spirochaetaceae bacterium]
MTDQLIDFLDTCPTAYHTADELVRRLTSSGFVPLDEGVAWAFEPRSRYLVRRGGAVVAWITGGRPVEDAGFRITTAHTDSPFLRIKHAAAQTAGGYLVAPIEVYGSPIYSTWFDRELEVAGVLAVVSEGDRGRRTRLLPFRLADARVVIPSLAYHLNRSVNDGAAVNAHDHLRVVLGSADDRDPRSALKEAAARSVGVGVDSIIHAEFHLCDARGAAPTGLAGEFLTAHGLDNKAACFSIYRALANAEPRDTTLLAVWYDHEEIGSRTPSGAESVFLRRLLERIAGSPEAMARAAARSAIVSQDAAHAVHPNYTNKHDRAYAPVLGGGPVLKTDVNQRYAASVELAAHIRLLCREAGFAVQELINRADNRPGSTVGPFSAAQTGIATIDVGIPLLAMHSVRETAAPSDVNAMTDITSAFFAEE